LSYWPTSTAGPKGPLTKTPRAAGKRTRGAVAS